jgi:hypothetical protein
MSDTSDCSFAAELASARDERLPRIALRRHADSRLDDVVVEDVETFRAEMMDGQRLWLSCYLRNGERVTWSVWVGGKRPRAPLAFEVVEVPDHIDFDTGAEVKADGR